MRWKRASSLDLEQEGMEDYVVQMHAHSPFKQTADHRDGP
jgi:hypothetical protein